MAEGICAAAAEELALSVTTALRRVGTTDAAPLVSAIGGVFRAPAIRGRFEELLRAVHPGVRFEAPHGTGLDGAAALGALAPGHPLRELVSEA